VSASIRYPNIHQWFGPMLKRLGAFPTQEYIALKCELGHANEEGQYQRDLRLLDSHVAVAAEHCSGFSRLIKERRNPGKDLAGANRMILGKLAEVRAVAGLHGMGFTDIRYRGTPDLCVSEGSRTLAVEVTCLADSPLESPIVNGGIQLTILDQRDENAVRKLADELFTKIEEKCAQLSRASTSGEWMIWISLGRDYFTAGRYERRLTGLRRKMPGFISDSLSRAIAKVQSQLNYPQLRCVIVCPGREESEVVRKLT
jgi:hypothetical protein